MPTNETLVTRATAIVRAMQADITHLNTCIQDVWEKKTGADDALTELLEELTTYEELVASEGFGSGDEG